jgi:hypothetical protein
MLTSSANEAFRDGLRQSGLDGNALELTAALRIALTTPDAAERWLAGEAVFHEAKAKAV